MAAGQANRIVHQLRWLAHGSADRARTDGQLLEGFISRQDDDAFAELVRRHGPMVLGVCRRIVGHSQDAEDAFQATFMVLVRRARAVVPRELVGNWLHGVAYRVALDLQARSQRRRDREKQVEDMPHPCTPPADHAAHELRPVLDRELSRLPEKYRVPIVLCDLEGRSRKEVARQLKLPEGTLSSRLAAGRKLLAGRLARRGLLPSAALLAAALTETAAPAAVPASLALATVKAAAVGATAQAVSLGLLSARAALLTEGVMKAMLISKLKSLAAVLLTVGLLTSGAGALTLTADEPHEGRGATVAQAGPAPQAPGDRTFRVVGDLDGDVLRVHVTPARPRKVIILEVDAADPPLAGAKDEADVQKRAFDELFMQLLARGKGAPADHARAVRDAAWEHWLGQVHKDRRFSDRCTVCHQATHKSARSDWRGMWLDGRQPDDVIVIRVPKKGTPDADAVFLRRVFLDVAGRLPTPLELRYLLADNDPRKQRKVVEELMRGNDPKSVKAQVVVVPARQPDRAARAEEYVKAQLGKKQLSAEERQLLRAALEFAAKEHTPSPAAPTAPDQALRLWLQTRPNEIVPAKEPASKK